MRQATTDLNLAEPPDDETSVRPAVGAMALTIGAVGVVYGDIGTSPIYAFRAALFAATPSGGPVTEANVLGILSLILWSLILIVTVKYILVLTRADNKGEGGALALMALVQRALGASPI